MVRPAPAATAVLVAAVQGFEDAEHALQLVGADADAVVAHVVDPLHRMAAHVGPAQPVDLDPLVRAVVVLEGVADQVSGYTR